jgi:hypothetical protein
VDEPGFAKLSDTLGNDLGVDGVDGSAFVADYIWTGDTDTDWDLGSNWSALAVPGVANYTLIPAGRPNYPILNVDASVGGIVIEDGASVDIPVGFNLAVEVKLVNNGTLRQTLDVPVPGTTEFLHIQDLAGLVDQYYGVDVSPTGAAGLGMTTVEIQGNQMACTTNMADPIMNRCWDITPTDQQPADIRFWYTEAERNGQDVTDGGTVRVWHYDQPGWSEAGTAWTSSEMTADCQSGGGLACWVEATGITAYTPFNVGNGPATPTAVTLRAFAAQGGLPVLIVVGVVVAGLAFVALRRRR